MKAFVILLLCGISTVIGQRKSFEVASVKEADLSVPSRRAGSCHGNDSRINPRGLSVGLGRCRFLHFDLKQLISYSYGIEYERIVGGPSWVGSVRYTVDATSDDPRLTHAELLLMLQNLLAERFGLRLHRETKDVSGYVLVVAKGGMKLREVTEKDQPQPAVTSVGRLTGNMTTGLIASSLAGHLRTGVVDGTRLSGTYLVDLKWHPQEGQLGARSDAVSDLPSIFTAVQEQLGLRLEASKVPINLIVIDSVQKPKDEQ
jgi:uncharacterized protein (TIGR03435 family)